MFNNTPVNLWKHNIEHNLPIVSRQKQHNCGWAELKKKIDKGAVDSNDNNNYMYAPIRLKLVNKTLIQQSN